MQSLDHYVNRPQTILMRTNYDSSRQASLGPRSKLSASESRRLAQGPAIIVAVPSRWAETRQVVRKARTQDSAVDQLR